MSHPLPPGSRVQVEHVTDWVIVHEGQKIGIKEGIPEGDYIVLEDLGKRVILLPKGESSGPVTTYKL